MPAARAGLRGRGLAHAAGPPGRGGARLLRPAARNDAAEVARIAGFPFEICDLSDEFERTVIGDFVAEHEAGRTPNPCARCNGEIKFGAFLRRADELGIEAVATGHYVRTDRSDGRLRLLRGADRAKDQSYMLHMLGQRELSRSRSRSAGWRRPKRARPPNATGCRREQARLAGAVLRAERRGGGVPGLGAPHLMREGEVVDTDGRVLAHHAGSAAFTVGQRRGLGVAGPEPSYVLEIDARANRVVVGPGELLARSGAIADRVSWVAGGPRPRCPSRRRSGSATGATTSRRWSSRSGTRSGSSSGRRSADRARSERRRLPGRGAPRRRPDRRHAPLSEPAVPGRMGMGSAARISSPVKGRRP